MHKRILITGGAGFVGSNLCSLLKEKYSTYEIVAFDSLKRRGSELNIQRLKEREVVFIHGDIRCREDFEQIGAVDFIIDASAEPSVLSGLNNGAEYLINTNLTGSINCLYHADRYKADFMFLSTSRVYPIKVLNEVALLESATRYEAKEQQTITGFSTKGVSEDFPLNGSRSLYGTTKLAAELVIAEYNDFKGIRTVINRCGVIAGPWQMGKVDQGFVSLWVARHFWKQSLLYIGYGGLGKQVRDVLHIQDLFHLIDYQIHNMDQVNGCTFNIGGGLQNSVSLREMTDLCQEITGNRIKIDQGLEPRSADIRLYYTDASRAKELMEWQATFSTKEVVVDTFNWIRQNESLLKSILK